MRHVCVRVDEVFILHEVLLAAAVPVVRARALNL